MHGGKLIGTLYFNDNKTPTNILHMTDDIGRADSIDTEEVQCKGEK